MSLNFSCKETLGGSNWGGGQKLAIKVAASRLLGCGLAIRLVLGTALVAASTTATSSSSSARRGGGSSHGSGGSLSIAHLVPHLGTLDAGGIRHQVAILVAFIDAKVIVELMISNDFVLILVIGDLWWYRVSKKRLDKAAPMTLERRLKEARRVEGGRCADQGIP